MAPLNHIHGHLKSRSWTHWGVHGPDVKNPWLKLMCEKSK